MHPISNDTEDDTVKILIELWAGVFDNIEERAITVCSKEMENSVFIRHLLIHHQKCLVDKLFHHAEFGKRLQEKYTVLYYVSQILFNKGKENNLQLRIPPELKSTVEDVLKSIEDSQLFYNSSGLSNI